MSARLSDARRRALALLSRDAMRIDMWTMDCTPGELVAIRALARLGYAEFSESAYRLTAAGRDALGHACGRCGERGPLDARSLCDVCVDKERADDPAVRS